ncbi:hypothetical protein C8J57DRAFT_1719660 [Mycena rebaudengoi]|nr:hypothetical protein C8J57DRAFT_1719660 [Mycena rebaudengoi]
MPSRTKVVLRKRADDALSCAMMLFCCPFLMCLFCFVNPRAPRRITLRDPRPLPTRRIDIRRKKMKPQPRSCHLLSLPTELRQLIFELVLGHRIVALALTDFYSYSRRRLQVHATFHRVIAELPSYDLPGLPAQHPDDKIPIAFLRVCRQVYLEGTESMHRSNTYYSDYYTFQCFILSGLGLHCLPHIRRVRLELNRRRDGERWYSVCQLLKQAGIEHLMLEFTYADVYYDPSAYNSLNEDLCSCLLEIRGLRTLDITVKYKSPNRDLAVEARDRLRGLMVGPGADERYHVFLEGKRLKEQEAQAASQAKSSTGTGSQWWTVIPHFERGISL